MSEHIHPESMRQLRELVKLHGVVKVQAALTEIKEELQRQVLSGQMRYKPAEKKR